MAVTTELAPPGRVTLTPGQIALGLLLLAVLFALARPMLPLWMIDRPDDSGLLPFAQWLDAFFNAIKGVNTGPEEDQRFGLIHITRTISAGLEVLLNISANLLEGKRRWPFLGPIPWPAVATVAAIIGYWLGGWRMALLAGGTFVWVALIGQWKMTMQTLSVIAVAAPLAFLVGLGLGLLAWKYRRVDVAIKPILAVLQTLPFFTYLLPAVIFFKVGPTAGAVATIIYAIPPMVLMTTVGLKKVSPEIVEAGKMAGCTRWQMLRHVYIPAARTEILVGVNQIIMLCLAMVVLTAFIGMPGLGAKLLSMMNSFKLGRSFEIGVTIVLVAVMLDQLSKQWVVKQPERFERGTPWWRRHMLVIGVLAGFAGAILIAWLASFIPDIKLKDVTLGTLPQYLASMLDEVSRRQALSQGKPIDSAIKAFLDIDSVQSVTGGIRTFLIQDVLIPFRNALLWLPIPTVVLIWAALGWRVGGAGLALITGGFFAIIAMTGWWDRAIITLYAALSSVVLAVLIGLPLGIWAAKGSRQPLTGRSELGEWVGGLTGLVFKRMPLVLGALLVSGLWYYFVEAVAEDPPAFFSFGSTSLYLFGATFGALWWCVRRWPRDKVMIGVVDTAQTFPSFIYLIPAIMLFGINDVAVIFSILIYTLVPVIRYTIEGLRAVPNELTEAADMAGATERQKLWNVQLPLALPTLAVGFNQAIMFAFFMVIIAAFIGTQDLGQELQRTLAGTDLGKNFVLGISVALMALTFDQLLTRWAADRRRELGLE
ncbi:MAG: ABC transporter permease subunit [Pseudomonadota bacterium]